MQQTEAAYAPSLDLTYLLRVLYRRLTLILGTIGVVLSLALLYLFLATPLYTASTEILIDPRKKHTIENEVVPSGLGTTAGDNFALVDSQVKVILSDAVLRPVVRSEHLATNSEFLSTPGFLRGLRRVADSIFPVSTSSSPESAEDRALIALREHIEVKRDNQTYVIDIAVTTASPVLSARVAQAVAESYIADQSRSKADATQLASNQMDSQLATLRERLIKAESEVQKFRAENNLQQGEDGVLIDTRHLEELTKKLTEAQADVAEKKSKSDQVHRLLKQGVDAELVAASIKSETVSRLRDQYALAARREAILSTNLLPSHPQVQQARSEVERLGALIRAEVERIAKGVDLEYQAAKERLAGTEAAIKASRKESDVNDKAYIKLNELQREAETTKAVYESFLSRVKEMNESERVFVPDARIISPASIPERPTSPKKKLILALALIIGCAAGGGLAFVAEQLNPRIYSGTQLLTTTGLKPLVTIPKLGPKPGLIGRFVGHQQGRASFYEVVLETLEGNPRSGFRAAVQRLLSYIVDFDTGGQPRVVLLTSSLPGEGKSALSLSLAVAAASSGIRTLLIDASASDPALTKVFGKDQDIGAPLEEQVITDQRLGLSFLSLTDDDHPLTGWANRQDLTEAIAHIAKDYDLTLIDGGLLYSERGAAALISASQAILFLSRASTTSQETASIAASDLLQMANGRRCAAVLTMATAEV
jgi:polysaccharide biosynthesis transport protein